MSLINKIRERIQFLITIYILFSSVIYGFYKAIGSDELLSNSNALILTTGIACYVVVYLVVGTLEKVNEQHLNLIKNSINANLLFLTVPLCYLPILLTKDLPKVYGLPILISLWEVMWLPIIIFTGVILFAAWHHSSYKK